jgi:riboflavin synthase
MFTGLIQAIGEVQNIQKISGEQRFEVNLKDLIQHKLEIGESIAINGACHTLESLIGNIGLFFSSAETLDKTNLINLKPKELVNLELSLTPNTRMGGHFVSGHIDGLAKLLSIQNLNQSYLLHFELLPKLSKYLIEKGSITLNGISLTIAKKEKNSSVFSVAVIPHTWQNTNLKNLKIGQLLNCEVDLLAKYIENFREVYN